MSTRYKIYAVLVVLSIIYRIYEKDMEGLILSLLVLPMCFMHLFIDKPEDK